MRLKLFGGSVDSLAAHQTLYVGGASRRLLAVRPVERLPSHGSRVSTTDRRPKRCADRWSRWTARRCPLEEGEYYHADLIGLPCVDGEGRDRGRVVAVESFGAGDLLEIELGDGKRSLIPFKPGIADKGQSSHAGSGIRRLRPVPLGAFQATHFREARCPLDDGC